MKVWLGLVWLDISERKTWPMISLAIGILIWLTCARLDPARQYGYQSAVGILAMLAGLIIYSIRVGSQSEIAGVLAGRSFELARPLSGFQLCTSKLAAGFLTVFGCTALIGLPAFLFRHATESREHAIRFAERLLALFCLDGRARARVEVRHGCLSALVLMRIDALFYIFFSNLELFPTGTLRSNRSRI